MLDIRDPEIGVFTPVEAPIASSGKTADWRASLVSAVLFLIAYLAWHKSTVGGNSQD